MKDNKIKLKTIRIVIFLGIIVSLLSFLETHWPPLAALCTMFGSGCKQAADFTLFGVALSIWGIAFYAALLILFQFSRHWAFRLTLLGVGIESTLVGLLLSRNLACVFCLVNAAVMLVLLLLFIRRNLIWQAIAICLIGYVTSSYLLNIENPQQPLSLRPMTGSDVVAWVNDEPITLEALESGIATQLYKTRNEIYKLKREQLFNMIRASLANRLQNPSTETDEQPNEAIDEQTRLIFAETLRDQPDIDRYLEKPTLPFTTVHIGDNPSMGPDDAQVTVIEFSDYLCPACRWAHPITKEIKRKYQGKIRWIYKDYPLKRHAGADKMAEAAHCADDQNRFWEFQDVLFETKENPDQNELNGLARSIGLDVQQFKQCMETEKYAQKVANNKLDGQRAGVSATPSFMINGRLNPGSMSLENFSERIDEALKEKR